MSRVILYDSSARAARFGESLLPSGFGLCTGFGLCRMDRAFFCRCGAEWGMVFYNNIISLPILMPVALVTGEIPGVLSAPPCPDEHPWCGASHAAPGRCVDQDGADGAIQPLVTVL